MSTQLHTFRRCIALAVPCAPEVMQHILHSFSVYYHEFKVKAIKRRIPVNGICLALTIYVHGVCGLHTSFFLKKKATAASYLRNRIDLTSIVDFTRLETLFNPIRSATKDWKERMPSRPFPMGNELIDASRLESAHSMAVSSHCILVATNLINEPLLTDD